MSSKIETLRAAALAAWRPVRDGFDKLKPAALTFGKALISLRAASTKHGEFTSWLRKHNIDENRAMYCLRLAQGKVRAAKSKQSARAQFLEPLVRRLSAIYREAEKGNVSLVQKLASRAKEQFEETLDRLVASAKKSAAQEKKAA